MKKLLILLAFFMTIGAASELKAQYYGGYYGGGYGGYYGGYGYPYPWGWNYSTAAFAVDQFFGTVQQTWTAVEQTNALENQILIRRNNLENYKSIQRYHTEGIPAFSPVAPDGRPRNPKITWQDVESIRP